MLKKIINWLLPPICVLCQERSKQTIDLCAACAKELPWWENKSDSQTLVLFQYAAPINHLITGLKFNHQLIYARLLGELLTEKIKQHYANKNLPELIIPVPLHPQRLRERGFNQALELARPIAKQLKIKFDTKSCQRIVATKAQSDLPAKDRAANVKNVFTVSSLLKIKHVAVIDDVMTTGHTITEFCLSLQKAGVEQIDVWCCAKTKVDYAEGRS